MGTLLSYSLAVSLWMAGLLLPDQFLPWLTWRKEALAFAGVLLAGAVALTPRFMAKKRLQIPSALLLFSALALWAAAQFFGGQIEFAGELWVLWLYLFMCATAWAMGWSLGRIEPRANATAHILAACLLVLATLSLVIALAQVLQVWESSPWIIRSPNPRRPGGNLAQPNQFATLLVMGLASLLYLYENRKVGANLAVLLAILFCGGLAISESRTGLLNFAVLLAYWIYGHRRAGLGRLSPWWGAPLALVLIAFYLSWPLWYSDLNSAAQAAEVNTSAGLRPIVWGQLLEAVQERPWLGWGLNEVPKALHFVLQARQPAVSEAYSYSHNILLDLAIGLGVPLMMLIVGMLLIWLWRRLPYVNTSLAWYCLAVVLPLWVHSTLEFPFTYAYFLAPTMLMLGMFDGLAGKTSALSINSKTAGVIFLSLAALSVWSAAEYLEIEEDFRVLRFEDLRVGKTPADYQRPRVYLLTQLDALLHAGRIVPRPDMDQADIELARKVTLRYPWPAIQNRYALTLALNGEPEAALRELRVIKAMHSGPNYALVRDRWEYLTAEQYPQLRAVPLP